MNTIAIIIPTRGRPDRIKKIVKNVAEATTLPYAIYFGIDPDDIETQAAITAAGATAIVNAQPSTYGPTVNNCYHRTSEPFLLLGADDIEFDCGWDLKMMAKMKDDHIGIVGHYDNWPISQTGCHGSHLLVRREYIRSRSGVDDEIDTIYSSAYWHYNTDIETEQTAMKRGAFAMSDATIRHHHWVNHEAFKDQTYCNAQNNNMAHDAQVYNQRRKRFEQYLLEYLQVGKVYRVNSGTLSIVLPIYNCYEETRQTIESLYQNTYHEFELILIDNGSTDTRIRELINELPQQNIKRFILPENKYCTFAWNFGVTRATGDYIAIINNDITLSKNWDVVLMNHLGSDNYIASPYQTDFGCAAPYGKAERAGNIDIRGACFMISRTSTNKLFPIPKELVMWFGDYWLAWKCEQLGKLSVFCSDAVIYHMGSKSSQVFDNDTGLLWWINRGDALQFQLMTGVDTKHWQDLCNARCIKCV